MKRFATLEFLWRVHLCRSKHSVITTLFDDRFFRYEVKVVVIKQFSGEAEFGIENSHRKAAAALKEFDDGLE